MRLALIKAHPDLANKTQRAAGLTAESTAEQNSVGLDRLSDAEYEAFERVNNAYRSKFGFPYIVCVRRQTRDSILRDFERRLPNDAVTEMKTSIEEICRIAALRLDQLVIADDRLPIDGRLSTHVLDTHSGKPAAGVAVELVELSDLGMSRVVTRTVTNCDGRTDQPLIGGRPVPIGRYELTFSVGEYFAARGVSLSDPPFLDQIPVALFGQRTRRPSPRAAIGDALELRDLSGELVSPLMVRSAAGASRTMRPGRWPHPSRRLPCKLLRMRV